MKDFLENQDSVQDPQTCTLQKPVNFDAQLVPALSSEGPRPLRTMTHPYTP